MRRDGVEREFVSIAGQGHNQHLGAIHEIRSGSPRPWD